MAGFLGVHAPAQAEPRYPLPLAPACTQFIFSGPVEIRSAQGTLVTFFSTGAAVNGAAKYSGAGLPAVDATVNGSITGDSIALTLTSSDPGVLPNAQYSGKVDDNGFAAGKVKFVGHDDLGDVDWNATARFFCAQGAQNGGGAAEGKPGTVTVLKDSDVYDAPGGNRLEEPFFLDNDSVLTTVKPCADNWCLLQIPNLPGGAHGGLPAGQAWVYSGDDFLKVN
ncbi:hypothetical protein [Mycolicibacterium stellerae]|uniref:hypothetical protein n=1 Tax=Mycolicibacterium stellerae TaxID=2358193 RepID=UPI0013DDF9DF|nr:hypothetical protein [Mycolicibacterium stellerae]